MNSEQIKCFLIAAKSNNFTETARQLYTSQPTVSKQIRALESELGVTLFERHGASVDLTEIGALYADCFYEINAILEYYSSLSKQSSGVETPTLKIGMLEGLDVSEYLAPVLDIIKENGDSVEMDLSFLSHKELNARLSNRTIDIGVTLHDEITRSDNFEYIILANLEHGIAAHKSIDISTDGVLDYAKVRNQEFYISADGSLGFKQYYDKLLDRFDLDENKIHIVPNIETQILSVESGIGISGVSNTPRIRNNPDILFYRDDFSTMSIVAAWNSNNLSRSKGMFALAARKYSRERRRM